MDDMDNRLLVMKKTAPARVSPPFLVPSHACVRLPSPVVHKLPFVAVRPASLVSCEGEAAVKQLTCFFGWSSI